MKQETEKVPTSKALQVKSQKELRPKKTYIKPAYQKHETLKVAASATQCPGPVGS